MSSFRKTFVVTRYAAGDFVDGYWVEGSGTPLNIEASVQPLKPHEILLLPEARRNQEAFKIYTDEELFVSEPVAGTNSDKITINGEIFEIISVSTYGSDVIPHYKAIAVKPT